MNRSARHLWTPYISSAIYAALAVSAAACTTDAAAPAPADFTSGGGGATAADSAPARVVASVDTTDGARVVFVDENDGIGDPAIGIEISSSTTTPATDALLAQEPSALELYLAISPAAKAPRALVLDHEASRAAAGSPGAPPRRLVIATATGESVQPYDCSLTNNWINDFTAWAPVLDGQYIAGAAESGYTTGYVGYAPTFYFDVCRPADVVWAPNAYWTGVQRRTSSSGTWTTISSNTDALNFQFRRWRYYRTSLTCTSYQYQLVVQASPLANHYRRAARWADEWSCQAGL